MQATHSRFLAWAAGLMLLLAGGTAVAADTVRCESRNGEYRSCPVNTSSGVTLSRQLSSQGCWQGDTWGYDRNRIWVTRGCRAEFRVGSHSSGNNDGAKVAGALIIGAIAAAAIASHNNDRDDDRYDNGYNDGYNGDGYSGDGYYNGREIRCESRDGRYQSCGHIQRRQQVEIRRQLSNRQCVYGRNWGVDGRQLWVDDGCRAIFVVY
jgi:hypothetical protein